MFGHVTRVTDVTGAAVVARGVISGVNGACRRAATAAGAPWRPQRRKKGRLCATDAAGVLWTLMARQICLHCATKTASAW